MNAITFQNERGICTPARTGSSAQQERSGEDGDAHVVLARVIERIALERQPDAGVERLHLRHRVGDVHRVGVPERGLLRRAPDRVLAARHVAAREQRFVPVALLLDLLARRNARVQAPRRTLDPAGRAAVDVDRR